VNAGVRIALVESQGDRLGLGPLGGGPTLGGNFAERLEQTGADVGARLGDESAEQGGGGDSGGPEGVDEARLIPSTIIAVKKSFLATMQRRNERLETTWFLDFKPLRRRVVA
jgi:hypothetical protein